MAMPTSAVASAGASLTPVAGHRHDAALRFEFLDHCALLFGQHFGLDLVMPSFRATAIAVVRLSPVSMTIAMPSALRRSSAGAAVSFTGSAMAMTPATFAVDGDEDCRRALAPEPLGLRLEHLRRECRARLETARCR